MRRSRCLIASSPSRMLSSTRSPPFLLLAAGTPDAPRRRRRAGTFTERAFRRIPVGRLSRPETLRALVEPAKDAGRPVREEAAQLLAAESQDHPCFIQLLGSETREAGGAAKLTAEAARRGTAATRSEIETFHAERHAETRGREVEGALVPLATLLAERGGRIRDGELQTLLRELAARESIPDDRHRVLTTLSDLGAIREIPSTGGELGIPSFADFLLEHYAEQAAAG